jgi:hypothetical protein
VSEVAARSIVEMAKRLADDGFTPWEDFCHLTCELCWSDFADDGSARHEDDCPWLAMPRIVAALEAAERIVAALDDDGPTDNGRGLVCRLCGIALSRDYHDAGCPWMALVEALRGATG